MVQANSGMYRIQDSYLDACKRFQRQESSSAEGAHYDMEMDLRPDIITND